MLYSTYVSCLPLSYIRMHMSIHAVICDPPCVQGTCVDNDTCHCAEAYEGPKCTVPGMYMQ